MYSKFHILTGDRDFISSPKHAD